MDNKSIDKRIIIGILIFIAGAALLASNFGIINFQAQRYLLRWEVFLIGIGIISLFSNQKKGFGVILIAIGSAFYLRDFLHLQYNFWQLFWPVILIIIGLVIIFHQRTHRSIHTLSKASADTLDEIAIFGSTERMINSENFQGGKITCIFGGQKLIFTKAKLASGRSTIEMFALFGGFELIVPDDWKVKVNITPVFGGFADKRISRAQAKDGENELYITGTVVFGGGEIKSF